MLKSLKRPQIAVPLILGLGILLVVCANIVWVRAETRPPHWDMARHLWTSLQYRQLLLHDPGAILRAYFYYPPLIYVVASISYALFGVSVVAAVAGNNVFLVIGAVAVYGIGRRVGTRTSALLGALVFATSPMIATQFKEFQIDGPLASLTAVALWALVRSPDFSDLTSAVVLGLTLGLGLLTKWTLPGVLALPVLYALGLAVWRTVHDGRWAKRLLNVAVVAALALAIAGYWYYTHRHQLKLDLVSNGIGQAKIEGDPTGFTAAALSYYALNLLNAQLYLAPLLLFGVGVWRAVVKRSHALILLMATIVSAYGFFTAVANKDPRYTLPFIGAVAVLATFWTAQPPRKWRRWLQGAVAVYAVLTFWAMSFGIPGLPKEVGFNVGGRHMTLWGQHGYIIGPPSGENWHLEEVMKTAKGSSLAYGGPDTIWLNSWGIAYYASKYNVELTGVRPKYVLLRTTANGASDPAPTDSVVVRQDQLPDGTRMVLWRRN